MSMLPAPPPAPPPLSKNSPLLLTPEVSIAEWKNSAFFALLMQNYAKFLITSAKIISKNFCGIRKQIYAELRENMLPVENQLPPRSIFH